MASVVLIAGLLTFAAADRAAAAGPSWWQVDTHQHSAFSGDARADLGLDAADAKLLGYNAVFVTDHDRLNSFSVEGANGSYLDYRDARSGRWVPKTLGSTSSSTNAVVASPAHSGTNSVHLAVTSSTAANGRTMVFAKRGANLRSGDVTLDFWVLPVHISAGSGVDVSVSLGGDVTTGVRAYGYTTADGVPHPEKSTVLVWQLGGARAAPTNGAADVLTSQLPYTLGAWNHYVIDVTTGAARWTPAGGATMPLSTAGVNALPAADKPAEYVVLGYAKMEASATNGSAEAYFDDYVLQAASPHCPAVDFVYRNRLIDSGRFNGVNAAGQRFVLFPAREMGQINHTQQFNFDITRPSRFYDAYSDSAANDRRLCAATNRRSARWRFARLGSDNVASVQASGFPAQDNHPGITDTTADVVRSRAHGADLVEVQSTEDYSSVWDAILRKHHQVIGTYGSDTHQGIARGAPADFIDAPSLTLVSLMRSLFEGRLYMARNDFAGRIVFNLDRASPSPYPARYPVYVAARRRRAPVHLAISGGLAPGQRIVWIYGGRSHVRRISDTASGPGYDVTRSIPLAGAFTYVRAEIRESGGKLIANTEPIFFHDVRDLPAGMSYHVESLAARTGCGCTVRASKGFTRARWRRSSHRLALTLVGPSHGTADLRLKTARRPRSVAIDGLRARRLRSPIAHMSASRRAWAYDRSTHLLYVREARRHARSHVSIAFAGR